MATTIEEIKNEGCELFTTATEMGYIYSGSEPRITEYNGRYGKGYKVAYPNNLGIKGGKSNRYHRLEYWIR